MPMSVGDIERLAFNTAIAAMMIFVNEAISWDVKPVSVLRTYLQLLAPFAPHLSEQLWRPSEMLGSVALVSTFERRSK